MLRVQDLIEKGEKQPNLTIGVLVSIAVVIFTIIFRILFGGKKKPVVSCFTLNLSSLTHCLFCLRTLF